MTVAPPRTSAPAESIAIPQAEVTSRWVRRIVWMLLAAIAIAVGLMWLSPGFPQRLVVDVTGWFDTFRDWAIQNKRSSWLFVSFLTPIEDSIRVIYDGTVNLLERITWVGLVTGASAIADVPRRSTRTPSRSAAVSIRYLVRIAVLLYRSNALPDGAFEPCRSWWQLTQPRA